RVSEARRSRRIADTAATLNGALSELESKQLVAEDGISLPAERLARSADEAAEIASAIGFPVVLKVQSRDLPHKSDAGGVRLGIRNAEQAAVAFEETTDTVRKRNPAARVDGILVSRQIDPVAELIAGLIVDPQFGPVVLVGS